MTKILTTLNQLEDYKKLESYMDGVVLGVKGLSVNYQTTYTKEEILSFLENTKKEVFLSMNKNMHEKDLPILEETLKFFDGKVKGIFYYDIALVNLKKKLNLKTPLVWAQEHMTTNYSTINFWKKYGVDYAFLSSEITLREILEMKEHTDVSLIVPIFGRIPMFTSKRPLIQNYFSYFGLKKQGKVFHLEKEGKEIPIEEKEGIFTVYSFHYLNGLKESLELRKKGIDYLYLNSYGLDSIYPEIVKSYYEVNEKNFEEKEKNIQTLLEGNTDSCFLEKETVYKVKL